MTTLAVFFSRFSTLKESFLNQFINEFNTGFNVIIYLDLSILLRTISSSRLILVCICVMIGGKAIHPLFCLHQQSERSCESNSHHSYFPFKVTVNLFQNLIQCSSLRDSPALKTF